MSKANVMDLASIGWSERRAGELRGRFGLEAEAARVAGESRGLYLLWTQSGELLGRLDRGLVSGGGDARARPVVGDWVVVAHSGDTAAPLRIAEVLPRSSLISRKQAGRESVEQLLAANVDLVCIVLSLGGGRGCTPRAAERYATMAWSSGAVPLIVLNKSDLAADLPRSEAEIAAAAPGVDVLATSCATGAGVEALRRRLWPAATMVLLGPSGAGKSSLANLLAGAEIQAVGEVRSGDKRGRHTTTRRELIRLPDGSLLIDSPGLREIQLWAEDSDLDDAFSDIAELADFCRYRDCAHSGEPGCGVQAAVASGVLSLERFTAYLELKRELAYQERRTNERARREERDKWKRIQAEARRFSKERRSGGR